MNEDQLRKIITQQKTLGRKPEELIRLAEGAGMEHGKVIPLIVEMFPGFKADSQPKNEDYQNTTAVKIWDPADEVITQTTFKVGNEKIQKKFEEHQKNPYRIRRIYFLFWGLGFAGTGLIFSLLLVSPDLFWNIMLGSGDDDSGGFGILTLPWLPLAWYVFHVKRLQRDLVKKIIADNNHWIYNPDENPSRWSSLANKFPKIFLKGNNSQELEDEFWGKFHTATQSRDFYSGIFHYATTTGSGKNRKTRHSYQAVFAIRLEKVLKNSLLLVPEKKGDRFWRKLGVGSDVNVESEAFNQAFKVYKNGEPSQQDLIQIFVKLSPAVQEQLVLLAQENPKSSIYFSGDVFLFVRDGMLFPTKRTLIKFKGLPNVKMHTNFFKKVELNPADEAYLQERFDTLLSIASNTAKYLD
ncbi:DUF3137 domain-containing protein [bacterium]|nr:DUF3137 domain-containing protein [bacterium]NCQ55472.1 DUF3137 domain-containing protein [Candidatus Parcubacteria bacterium]NCS67834.1 DUF3137 domain-containing protein [Candidatus Peregrinibacteria bacterium]NCS96352.1 DUF3137 domain-containing protein [bacterium]